MPLVAGTRITLFLPVNGALEAGAAGAVVEAVARDLGGCTRGPFTQSTFRGYWHDPGSGRLSIDEVAPVIVDAAQTMEEAGLEERLSALKEHVHRAYEQYGSPQAEVWLVAHPVGRVAT